MHYIIYVIIAAIYITSGWCYAEDVIIKEPPKSLNKYYPPESSSMEYPKKMIVMSNDFSGIFINIKEGNWDKANKRADRLLKVYKEIAKMVPEWKDYFNIDAASNFVDLLKTHDLKRIKEGVRKIGDTCHKCHVENRISVWTRYHWPSFKDIIIVDPLNEKDVKYEKYMNSISGTFNAISVYFEDKQYKKAGKALKAFKYRYLELKSTCSKCHTSNIVKKVFFSESIVDAIGELKKELRVKSPDVNEFAKNIEIVRKEGCKMCHLTHLSSSIIKEIWEGE